MGGVFKAIGNAVSGVVKAVGSIVKGVVSAVGSVVSGVLNFVMSPFLGLFGLPSMPDINQQNQTIQGVTLQRQGTDQQIPVIYGFRKVGGVVTFAETGSDSNKYLWVAYVLSEGPVEGLREIWINDIPVGAGNIPNLNAGQNITLSDAASGKLVKRTTLQFSNGNATNIGTAIKAGIFAGSPSWTTDMAYNGLAVVFARYEWINATDQATADANPFSGTIPTLQCTVLGRKITNLETLDISNPASIPNYTYSIASTSYSSNPANIILDYLRNPNYGKGLGNQDIDWDSFKKAANKYNQTVTYTGSGVTGPIQTLHAVVDTSQTIFANVKLLLQQCRSYLPYSRTGTYMLKVDDAGNPTDILSGSAPIVRTFTKDNIIGSITYTGIERTSKYNQIVATYCDPDQQWTQQSVTVPAQDSTEYANYLAQDGYRAQKGDLSFPWITNFAMAQDMARLALQKSRWQDTISFTATSEALDLMVGDCVYIQANILKFGTDPNAGAVKWRIVSTKVNNDYSVAIGCVRNQDSIYPHVSVTDKDYKTGVYVPQGVTRYYPPEVTGTPVGLLPPGYAPTDPNDPNNPKNPTSPTGPSGPLIDVITIYDVKFTYNGTIATATLTWTNPANTLANQVILTTVASGTTGGVTQTVNLGGSSTSVTITNLNTLTSYVVTAQVLYVTGDRSTKTITFNFTTGNATTAPITGGINLAADYFKTVTGSTVTSGNLPLATRQVSITLTQDISSGVNQYLNSVVVYYKPSANPKWYTNTIPVVATPGTNITFTISVGSRLYPSVPGGAVPLNCDDYDFIFRFGYSDGKQSKWQYRAMNNAIEWSGLQYQYNLFLRDMTSGQQNPTIYVKEDAGTYVPTIAGPGDITETRNITISVSKAQSYTQPANSIRLFLNPPVAADRVNWVGVRVYRHKAGQSGTGDYIDITPASYSTISGEYSALVGNLTIDETWEFVVVPLVTYGSSTVEAFNAQYLSGYFHNRTGDADYPSDFNWMSLWIVKGTEPIATAKGRLGSAVPKAIRNDTYFDSIVANTVLTSGHPSTPRQLSFTVKTSTVNGTNGHIAGVRVYYKFNSNLYWKTADYATSSENTSVTFTSTQTTPAMDLGVPQYPTFPYLADNYDFYFRILYTDGTLSKYCVPYINVNIEDNGLTTQPDYTSPPFANKLFQPQTIWTDLTLEANAPPGAVTKPTDLTLNLTKILDSGTGIASGNIIFYLDTPVAAMQPYYAGVRIYTRDMTATTISYTTNDNNQPIPNPGGGGGVASQPISWDKVYGYVITPMVWYQGALTPCTNSWYWSGAIHNRATETTGLNPYPNATNNLPADWRVKSAPQWVNTNTALTTLTTPIQITNPVVTVQSVNLITGSDVSQNYYQLKYVKPSNATSITIYRRACLFPNGYYTSNYYGVGRWETLSINDGGISNGSTVTVNLREATAANEFNPYWDPTLGVGVNLGGVLNYLYTNGTQTAPTLFNLQTATGSYGSQLLIVVNYSGGTSTQAYLLNLNTGVNFPNTNSTYPIAVSSNSSIVNTADYNTVTTVPATTNGVSLQRKLTEARTPVTVSNIIKPGTRNATGGGWTLPSVSPGII
jgi:hypothetical protein